MILGEKIVRLRKQRAWSQEELASQLGISRQSVSKWESGASIPDLDKIISMSRLFGVSTDYLLKEEIEEPEADAFPIIREKEETDSLRSVTLEEATAFLDLTRETAAKIACGVSCCILSPICLLLLGGLSEYGGGNRISEDMAGSLGTTILLLMVAVGTAILISNGMRLEKYGYMEKEPFTLLYGVAGIVEKRKEGFAATFRTCITIGVTLCIIGVVPLLLFGSRDERIAAIVCLPLLLCFVAVGVFLFVWAGSINGSFDKVLQIGDHTPEKKEAARRTSFFAGAYWCIIVAVYIGVSLYTDSWHRSWIIWPVAGVAFAAFYMILGAVAGRKK